MLDQFQRLALPALVANIIYICWLLFQIESTVGWIFFVLECAFSVMVTLFVVNHWSRNESEHTSEYHRNRSVDIFIPVKNELIEILETTLIASININYQNKKIYILDDGHRDDIQALAHQYKVKYVRNPNSRLKPFKAANLNHGLLQSHGEIILALDVDQVPQPNILSDLVGYFNDESVGLVSTKQRFNVSSTDFNNDFLFYDYMQNGKHADGAGVSCGSGALYRRSALNQTGGFQEWNMVEDLYTSYVLHTHGYKSVYINKSYTLGDAPQDLKAIYKQRGTWALDSMRLLLWKMPLFNFKLPIKHRVHYLEMGFLYLVSALVVPAIYVVNYYSTFFNDPIIYVGYWYLVFKIPTLLLTLRLYDKLGNGTETSRMWTGLFPVYFKAFVQTLLYKKPKYHVTKKGTNRETRILLVMPQAIVILVGVLALSFHITSYGFTPLLAINLCWFLVMVYWLWPVFPRSLARATSSSVHIKKAQPVLDRPR